MRIKKFYWLWISIFISVSALFYINILSFFSEDVVNDDKIIFSEEKNEDSKIDISIRNIIIYPNQFDKNSVYIDVEIFSEDNGEGEVQIALLNNGQLVASNSIMIFSDEKNYFQSFLISENIDFEKNFEIGISALEGEKNILNNRHTFKSNLKIEKPKIGIISGRLNFNTPYIIGNLNADYDHFYPNPINGNLDITNFWFTKYDIILLDNFPVKPVSDKWLNLFLKKMISEKSSLIMNSRLDQDTEVLKNFFPIFGLKYKDKIDLSYFNNFSRYQKESFKSSFISTSDLYNFSKDNISELMNTIDWILLDSDIQYSFYIANIDNKINDSVLIYGYSNIVDSEIKNLNAEIFLDQKIISKVRLLYNPISGYYFTQFEANESGNYVFNIKDNNKLIDTINIDIYD